jgi:hypothetical protein
VLGVGGEGGAGNLHYARHIEHTAPELFCEKILRQTSVSNGMGHNCGTKGQMFLYCPGTKGQAQNLATGRDCEGPSCPGTRDRNGTKGQRTRMFFVPGPRDNGTGTTGRPVSLEALLHMYTYRKSLVLRLDNLAAPTEWIPPDYET